MANTIGEASLNKYYKVHRASYLRMVLLLARVSAAAQVGEGVAQPILVSASAYSAPQYSPTPMVRTVVCVQQLKADDALAINDKPPRKPCSGL